MKNIQYTIAALSVTLFVACSSPSQKVENAKTDLKDAKQELNEAQQDSIANFETFKKESEERINKNEIAIAAFKARMASNKNEFKEKDQKMIDELEQRNINMRKKIAEYKENGKDDWTAFKDEFNHDMDELGDAIKNITINNTN